MKQTTRFLLSLLLITGLVLSGVSTVWAAVAANTQIINEATLSYGVGADARTATASVTVTVSLVSGVATVTGSGDKTAPYTAPNTSLTMQFVVTANSNGPETYSVATSNGTTTNTTSPTAPSVPADFILGASITTIGSTLTVIKVPSDGSNGSSINGLQVGDTVVINGEVRTIIAADFTDPASGTASFTLNAALPSAPGAGVPVLEQKVIDVTAYSGTIQTVGVNIEVAIDFTITNGAGTTAVVTQDAIFTSGLATLKKYVRNFSSASGNTSGTGGQSFTFNGGPAATFYTAGVTGQTGDVLEYVLLIENTGAATVPNMRIDDTFPVDYVTIGTGAYSGKDVLHKGEDGVTETPLTITADGDAASLSGAVLTVYVGTGSVPATGTGGTIDAGKSVLVAYRVTIK